MQDFHLENIIKQTCSVITTKHWQPVFVIVKTARASSGHVPFLISVLYQKSMCQIH